MSEQSTRQQHPLNEVLAGETADDCHDNSDFIALTMDRDGRTSMNKVDKSVKVISGFGVGAYLPREIWKTPLRPSLEVSQLGNMMRAGSCELGMILRAGSSDKDDADVCWDIPTFVRRQGILMILLYTGLY